eukprot:TRINITY_DN48753_c0_g1_i1.p1 TRINITY_DN48753_c0_g1~~TRINITY_DN48753_c0_g1_i1.p1  ORF type:complete len:1069 (-),score=186.44 TRINITY_DN48753_c0_g1_i1:149-3043(-)
MESIDSDSPNATSQEMVYTSFGERMVDQAFDGFHSTLFAYGQTGTGKTTTIMGDLSAAAEYGVLPRMIQEVHNRMQSIIAEGGECQCTMQMLEIYLEQINDLLAPAKQVGKTKLTKPEVHVHPGHGVYVKNVTETSVRSFDETIRAVEYGNTMKAVAATAMNAHSSRAHTIVKLSLQAKTAADGKVGSCKLSDINVVDLAGRENEKTTMVTGERLVELSFINRSLMWLSKCIHELGNSAGKRKGSSLEGLSRFRNSKLTLLLSNSLRGNSRTAIITTGSPASASFDETISTLNFAATAKNIKLQAVANTSHNKDDMLKSLKEEVLHLQEQLSQDQDVDMIKDLRERLEAAELLAQHHAQTAAEIAQKSEVLREQQEESLALLGASSKPELPYLANISDDPHLAGRLTFNIPQRDSVFTVGADESADVTIVGLGIQPQMCNLANKGKKGLFIQLARNEFDPSSIPRVRLNDCPVGEEWLKVFDKDRLELGRAHTFGIHCADAEMTMSHQFTRRASLASAGTPAMLAFVLGDDADEAQTAIAQEYYTLLKNRSRKNLGNASTVTQFINNAQALRKLVDEANDITAEMKPNSGIYFDFAMESPILSFGYDSIELPRFCVRMIRRNSRTDQLWDVARTAYLSARRKSTFANTVRAVKNIGMGTDTETVVHIWNVDRFQARLHLMRAAYKEWSEDPSDCQEGGDFVPNTDILRMVDPWAEHSNLVAEDIKRETDEKLGVVMAQLETCKDENRRLRIEKREMEEEIKQLKKRLVSSVQAKSSVAAPRTRVKFLSADDTEISALSSSGSPKGDDVSSFDSPKRDDASFQDSPKWDDFSSPGSPQREGSYRVNGVTKFQLDSNTPDPSSPRGGGSKPDHTHSSTPEIQVRGNMADLLGTPGGENGSPSSTKGPVKTVLRLRTPNLNGSMDSPQQKQRRPQVQDDDKKEAVAKWQGSSSGQLLALPSPRSKRT